MLDYKTMHFSFDIIKDYADSAGEKNIKLNIIFSADVWKSIIRNPIPTIFKRPNPTFVMWIVCIRWHDLERGEKLPIPLIWHPQTSHRVWNLQALSRPHPYQKPPFRNKERKRESEWERETETGRRSVCAESLSRRQIGYRGCSGAPSGP